MQATVIDPADIEGLESALEKHNVSIDGNNLPALSFGYGFLSLNCFYEQSMYSSLQVSLFFTESPTNPFLRCVDIERVSKLCHDKGALVCIDGTFATPLNQKALDLGADIVLQSATKYLGGHNDVRVHTHTHTVFLHINYFKITIVTCLSTKETHFHTGYCRIDQWP